MDSDCLVLEMFREAAASVPAYGTILAEHGVEPASIRTLADFHRRVPIIAKPATFGRFGVSDLCRDGRFGHPVGLLTSSGQSSRFAFGLYDYEFIVQETQRVDEALVRFFAVDKKRTLLINCLPMGVQIPSRTCSVASTSVRPDMVVALVQQFGRHYEQIILAADAVFLKCVLELGRKAGICWPDFVVHAILGEEPLAENARSYLSAILGTDPGARGPGLILLTMGVAELGLHLLHETPRLARLRRALHADRALRSRMLGDRGATAPMVFTYDPACLYVEEPIPNHLVLTPLTRRPVQLVRYDTGDAARLMSPADLDPLYERTGERPGDGQAEPVVFFFGRQFAADGPPAVDEAAVKEAIYHDRRLAEQVTGNFRVAVDGGEPLVRVQLAPGERPSEARAAALTDLVRDYTGQPTVVRCQPYEEFGSGMTLDYERKFDYLGA